VPSSAVFGSYPAGGCGLGSAGRLPTCKLPGEMASSARLWAGWRRSRSKMPYRICPFRKDLGAYSLHLSTAHHPKSQLQHCRGAAKVYL